MTKKNENLLDSWLEFLIPDFFLLFLQLVTDSMFAELKECFMESFDANKDGKIDIREVCVFFVLFFVVVFL